MELFFDIENVYLCLAELFEIEMFLTLNWVLMINWIVCTRKVYMYKNGFGINNLQ